MNSPGATCGQRPAVDTQGAEGGRGEMLGFTLSRGSSQILFLFLFFFSSLGKDEKNLLMRIFHIIDGEMK